MNLKVMSRNIASPIVHTDDFAGWQEPLDWWPTVIKRVFEPIRNGARSVSYARSEWWPDHHREPVRDQNVTPVIILEGVSSLRSEFRDYISLGIWVDTPKALCLARGIERELAAGRARDVIEKEWDGLWASEDDYVRRDKPQRHADIVVDGRRPFEEQVRV